MNVDLEKIDIINLVRETTPNRYESHFYEI